MASSTTNLGLRKPDTTDNWSVQDDFNANMEKIDTFAGNANATYITNQYSNVLDAINALRASKTFPFTIQKAGNASYGDLPSGLSSTCEWNLICYGNKDRITAVLTAYTGASSKNGWSWTANIYNGAYTLGWTSVNSNITKTGYNMNQWMSELEDSDNSGYLWAQGNLRVITFQGKRRTHTEDEILFTLPAEHRPSMTVRCAGSYNGTSVVISLNTDGTGVLFVANGVTATGRIYFSVAFMH